MQTVLSSQIILQSWENIMRVTVSLPDYLAKDLKAIAKAQGNTQSGIVAYAIDRYLMNGEPPKKELKKQSTTNKVKVRKGSKGDNSFFAEFTVNGGKYVIAWEAIDDRELSVKFNIGIQQIIEEVEQVDDGHRQ